MFEKSLINKESWKAKKKLGSAAIKTSDFPTEHQGTFPHGAEVMQRSGVDLLCGWNAVILSMQNQYPDISPPSIEELQESLRDGMRAHRDVQFDEATQAQFEAGNNLGSDQIQLGLQLWGSSRGLNLVLGIIMEGTPARLEPHTDNDNISPLWIHNDSRWKDEAGNEAMGHWSGLKPATPPATLVQAEMHNVTHSDSTPATKAESSANQEPLKPSPPPSAPKANATNSDATEAVGSDSNDSQQRPKPTEDEDAVKFYCQAVRTSELMAKNASKGRPHASTIGLMPRILRAANLLTDEGIQDTTSSNAFSTFRDLFLHGSQQPTDENPSPPRLDKELENVAADVLSKTMLLGTTASNSDEKFLVDNFHPDVVFLDEASQTDEAEMLIGIMRNCHSLKHAILVGDGKQLSPVHQSRNQRTEIELSDQLLEGPACTFEHQINRPLFTRLQENQLPSTMFREQHRMAAGLE